MKLSFCLPFYRNSLMLAEQYRTWASYPDDLKAQIEIVLVDDCSPEPAMAVPRPNGLPSLRIYRMLTDIPWHQHAARNRAAHEAAGEWLFLTDMDHVLPAASLVALWPKFETDAIYTFHRLDAPTLTPKFDAKGRLHPHVNTFAMTRARYWRVGGYDEDCVGYGTDGYFRRRIFADGPATHLADVPVIRYPREVIADASTRAPDGMDPKAFRDAGRRSSETQARLKAKGHARPTVLVDPVERVL